MPSPHPLALVRLHFFFFHLSSWNVPQSAGQMERDFPSCFGPVLLSGSVLSRLRFADAFCVCYREKSSRGKGSQAQFATYLILIGDLVHQAFSRAKHSDWRGYLKAWLSLNPEPLNKVQICHDSPISVKGWGGFSFLPLPISCLRGKGGCKERKQRQETHPQK